MNMEQLAEYEHDNFGITVERDHADKKYIALSVTHNRYQWSSIAFMSREEVEEAILCLQSFLRNDNGE